VDLKAYSIGCLKYKRPIYLYRSTYTQMVLVNDIVSRYLHVFFTYCRCAFSTSCLFAFNIVVFIANMLAFIWHLRQYVANVMSSSTKE
jgi:hypothetical protein